jgi:hypothetical protein
MLRRVRVSGFGAAKRVRDPVLSSNNRGRRRQSGGAADTVPGTRVCQMDMASGFRVAAMIQSLHSQFREKWRRPNLIGAA